MWWQTSHFLCGCPLDRWPQVFHTFFVAEQTTNFNIAFAKSSSYQFVFFTNEIHLQSFLCSYNNPFWHASSGQTVRWSCFFHWALRIKKTRILVRSTRSEAFRTIQYLIPACSENVRMVRKLYAKPEVERKSFIHSLHSTHWKEAINSYEFQYQFKSRFVAIVEERLKVYFDEGFGNWWRSWKLIGI